MSGETEQQVSGWTVDTLNEHLQRIIDEKLAAQDVLITERDRRYEQRFEAQEKAIQKAETATEKRFESVNEFRSVLSDQTRSFLPREEYNRAHTDLASRLDEATKSTNEKLEQAVKTLESRIASLQQQLNAVEAVVK
jgi:predicted transcriptional regulator